VALLAVLAVTWIGMGVYVGYSYVKKKRKSAEKH